MANNLELYLNDVYEKECVFESEEEVDFIQGGIEKFVKKIVKKVFKLLRNNRLKWNIRNAKTENETEPVIPDIIKVGSFYERTKNHFPDEFDFIFVYEPESYELCYFVQNCCKNLSLSETLKASTKSTEITRKLSFARYVEKHGPAHMLEFKYETVSDSVSSKSIHVDLVPAERVTGNLPVDKCRIRPFRRLIESTGSCLLVEDNYSFTETEVKFMREELSDKHRKVYRILKHLINGHGDGEKLKVLSFSGRKGYSSYMIKVIVINHHYYTCNNSDGISLGPCVLDIMHEMCKYQDSTSLQPPDTDISELYTLSEKHMQLYKELKGLVMDETDDSVKVNNLQHVESSVVREDEMAKSYSSKLLGNIMLKHQDQWRLRKQSVLKVLNDILQCANFSVIKIVGMGPIDTSDAQSMISKNKLNLLRTTLSETHTKVYHQVLNTYRDKHCDTNLGKESNVEKSFSESFINLIMIYHINECQDTEPVEDCTSQVHSLMGRYLEKRSFFPCMIEIDKKSETHIFTARYFLRPYIQQLSNQLQIMQSQQHDYDWKRDMITPLDSVSRQYLKCT